MAASAGCWPARVVAFIIERALAQNVRALEVSEAAEIEWVAAVAEMSCRTADFAENCTPGYYNNEGRPGETMELR